MASRTTSFSFISGASMRKSTGSSRVRELKVRMTAVEVNLAGVHRRIDRVNLRLERIESAWTSSIDAIEAAE